MDYLLSELCQRADNYKLLSECYYLPDEELMQKIADFSQTETNFVELASSVPPAAELMLLEVDFARLFVGPYKLLAPPYGSFYLEDGKLMGDSTADVKVRYEKEGLDIVIKDAPDHIAMELEFMYFLITKQIKAIEDSNLQEAQACLHKQSAFLQNHLVRWLPKFAENVQQNSQTKFYMQLSQQTNDFVQEDMSVLLENILSSQG
ncbi:MAG: molecular chaperone TorD family protein [Planctomycetes bacterium]|nr:molecular chaperone TorD family protein [Planctomycetota bacterium]